ncbi:MAG: TlpA family protein disulfide reductase [Prevotellaceae bacterium]|jgi:peroxiredoxin|nr:TlpA family protein disulfide reductase [Prevotellaceae bacterium]
MKRIIFSILFFLPFIALQAQQTDNADIVKVGDMVPDFKVKMFHGEEVNIENLRGKVVLINFWATWCSPCIEELAVVQKQIIDRFKDKDFVFLPISREDTYDKIKTFREKKGHKFPMGMDPTRDIYSKFAKSAIPRNYLINKNGKIVYIEKGYTPELLKQLIDEIEKCMLDK